MAEPMPPDAAEPPRDFWYRLPGRSGGARPGAHAGSSRGAGQEFVEHASLLRHPDPRRLDIRASLRDLNGDWQVRVMRQRVGVPVWLVADVSESMRYGAPQTKLERIAELGAAIGASATRIGDTAGLLAFDRAPRDALLIPPSASRGVGSLIADTLRLAPASAEPPPGRAPAAADSSADPRPLQALAATLQRLAGRDGLVFLASDFHFSLTGLDAALAPLNRATLVPVVVWHRDETEPPAGDGLAELREAETGSRVALWLNARRRRQWREAVAARRAQLHAQFAARDLRPFWLEDRFDAERLSAYFLEARA